MDEEMLRRADVIMRICELLCGLPCIIVNIYTTIMINKVTTVHPNLRLLMSWISVIAAFVAFLHPLLSQIPPEYYSVQRGNYLGAAVFYLLEFILQVFTLVIDTKFFFVGLERGYAFRHRADYERRSSAAGHKVFALTFISLILVCVLKLVFFFAIFHKTKSIDDILYEGCVIQGNFYFFVGFVYSVTLLAWLYGAVQFRYLTKNARTQRHLSESLSERFEIKQTETVVRVLMPLSNMFGAALAFVFCLLPLFFCIYKKEGSTKSLLFQVIVNACYDTISAYNLFYTLFIVWRFAPLRRLLLKDLCGIFGSRIHAFTVEHTMREPPQSQEEHFKQLSLSWDRPPGSPFYPNLEK